MRWYSVISCCAVALLYLLFREEQKLTPSLPEKVSCVTARVIDGDTIVANCNRIKYRIRFTNIDAPELAQSPYGERAKQALTVLVSNKKVTLNVKGKDKYKRTLANVFVDDKDVSLELVEQGNAVVYSRYHPPKYLVDAQKQAKRAKLGIWSEKGLHQDPSYYRRIK